MQPIYIQKLGFIALLCCALLGISASSLAQADEIITYDPILRKTSKPLPFDKEFVLAIDSIKGKAANIFLYEVKYKHGVRQMIDNKPDLTLKPYDQIGQRVLVRIPALKPNSIFELVLTYAFPPKEIQKLHEINKEIYNSGKTLVEAKAAIDKKRGDFRLQLGNLPNATAFSITDSQYLTLYSNKLHAKYKNIIDNSSYTGCTLLSRDELNAIVTAAIANSLNPKFAYQMIHASNIGQEIQKGTSGFGNGFTLVDDWEFSKRVANLSASLVVIDSVQELLSQLYVLTNNNAFITNRTTLVAMRALIATSKKDIEENIGEIEAVLKTDKYIRLYAWASSGNEAHDLQTLSGSILSTDVGLTTLRVRSYSGDFDYIPKLFWGLNIHFRQINRHAKPNRLPGARHYKDAAKLYGLNEENEGNMLAHHSIFHHLSLSIGLTIGSMRNADEYDNLYNSMSLTIGPSYRFARVLRFTSGVAFLRARGENPLRTQKEIVPAVFASFSVDLDFIQIAKNFYGLLFP